MRIDSRLQLSTRGLRGLWGLHGGVSPSSIITSIVGPPRYFSPCVQISIYFRNISIKFVKGKRNLKKMNQFQILHWDSYSTPQELCIYIFFFFFFFFLGGGFSTGQFYPYHSRFLHWHWGQSYDCPSANEAISVINNNYVTKAPPPPKCDDITTTKPNQTQPCVYSMGCTLPSLWLVTEEQHQLRVNSSPLNKMAAILADNIFKCIFLNEKFCILTRISLKFVPRIPV